MNLNQINVGKELESVEGTIEATSAPKTTYLSDDLMDDEQILCRLCFGTASDASDLIEPCLCKGTIAKVHRSCLEKWLNIRGLTKCDLCRFEFKCQRKLRYGLFESIGIWFGRHQQQQLLLNDFGSFFTISIIALPMIIMLLQNNFDLFTNGNITKHLPLWYFILLVVTLSTWIGIYFTICCIGLNAHIRPWYQWWKSKKQIQLCC